VSEQPARAANRRGGRGRHAQVGAAAPFLV